MIKILIFLLLIQFSVLQAESEKEKESDFSCQTSHSGTLDYNFDVFCPKPTLIFKNDSDTSMKTSISKTPLKTAGYLFVDDKPKVKANTSICQFKDPDTKLLSSGMSNISWNFTRADQPCHHDSLKFSDYGKLPCEMKGEINHSRPLTITANGIRAFFNETNQICVTESQFLLIIFKIQKGLVCLLKVQQHKIDPKNMEKECKDIEESFTCGLYLCSRERDIQNELIQVAWPKTLSTSDQKPFFDYSRTVGGNNYDKMEKKTSIEDYFFELLLLALIIILLLICFLTNCCGLNDDLSDTHYNQNVAPYIYTKYGKKYRYPQTQNESGSDLSFPTVLPLANSNISNCKLKCAKKPACVCSSDKMGNNSGNKKWGYRGNEESYAPVRNDSSSNYVPTVVRG